MDQRHWPETEAGATRWDRHRGFRAVSYDVILSVIGNRATLGPSPKFATSGRRPEPPVLERQCLDQAIVGGLPVVSGGDRAAEGDPAGAFLGIVEQVAQGGCDGVLVGWIEVPAGFASDLRESG